MSEIKFTSDELKTISELSVKNNDITARFGQLAITKINLEKQSEQVEEQEFALHEELDNLRKEEQKILNEITEKYGPGSLNPETGVFTPSVAVTTPIEEEKK